MKKHSIFLAMGLLACITIPFSQAQAQTLQFNSAQYLAFACPATSGHPCDTTITIPQNSVWKIESAGVSRSGQAYVYMQLNGVEIYGGAQWTASPYVGTVFPIWLPSGTYRFSLVGGGGISGFVSAIQFNIGP